MEHITVIRNKDDYDKFIIDNEKALIFYTADYCPSCQTLKPFYQRLANRYHKYLAFALADVEECKNPKEILPAFTSFHGGEIVNREFGDNQDVLKRFIKELYKSQ
jgi:thiol-disulfide isomerase/thioredoxin